VGAETAIRCEGLTRFYGEVEALKALDLDVPVGSVFGFLGRNGAGKTTTIRLLTGLAQPTAGRAWVDGVETTNSNHTAQERFGYLPEEPAFYTWMTPREFLNYIGRIFRMPRAERGVRVDELLALVGLAEVANRRIAGFSRGMRQRLGLAQALIHRPPVLFLDEPTSALDPAGRREVLDLIGRLRGETTIFLSSHILADVERVCDTVGIVSHGRLLLEAPRDELLARYAADAVRLEFDDRWAPTEDFLGALRAQSWVREVAKENGVIRVSVHDIDEAKVALLPLIVAHDLILNRYEWVRPSLEEIFLSLSG
jgi:ABC-2 type transport system ATP-binding protein